MSKCKYLCAVLFLLLSSFDAAALFAQRDSLLRSDTAHFIPLKSKQNNAFFCEAFGNSGWLSLNLDFIYESQYSFRIGAAVFPGGTKDIATDFNQFPVSGGIVTMFNYLLFRKSPIFPYLDLPFNVEFGIGVLTDLTSHYRGAMLVNSDSRFKPTLFLGFRYQPFSGNHILRFGYTPFFDLHQVFHFAGVGYGYCIDPF